MSSSAFSVSGTVTGLTGTGLVLGNGGRGTPIAADGPFTLSSLVPNGAAYDVTVLAQPSGPGQTCTVTGGSGSIANANVTTVAVSCGPGFSISTASDPLAQQQWHLKNTGQNAFSDLGGTPGMDIDVDPAFVQGFTGSGVIVAVIDTGLEIAHEDLAANVVPNGSWNFNTGTTNPTNTTDVDGDHGTSVSGLIAMVRNAVGGIGVAPGAKLKGFNFLSATVPSVQSLVNSLGGSSANPASQDVFVFNQSFGIDTTDDIPPTDPTEAALESQYLAGVTSLRGGKGALYVKAAGNGFVNFTGSETGTDADCSAANATATFSGGTFSGLSCENANFEPSNATPYQVVVGATNALGVRATYSSAGASIWVSAPGGEFGRNAALDPGFIPAVYSPAMVTADQSGCGVGFSRSGVENGSSFDDGAAPNTQCNYTNGMNGTSSASPVTAGVIALVLEANPALTWRDVKHILASTARQVDAARADFTVALTGGTYTAEPAWTTNAAGFKFHNWYGFGMVDASAAVTSAQNYTMGQLGTFVDTGKISSGPISVAIPDNSVTGASSTLNVPVSAPVHFIEAVQITVSVTHPFTGDLGIELVSPSGTRSVLKNIRDGFANSADLAGMQLLSNAFYGENPSAAGGNWTIKVVDGSSAKSAAAGTLTAWSLKIFGH